MENDLAMKHALTLLVVLILFSYGASNVLSAGSTVESAAAMSLQEQLNLMLTQKSKRSFDPAFLVRLAGIYLDLGDDVSVDAPSRKTSYEEGARVARQAIALQEHNADAHYLYAANLGSAAQLAGFMASAWALHDLKQHIDRALSLNPQHAPALHMKGMILEELPGFLGGDAPRALTFLRLAVATDPDDVHARLDLAKAYIKRKDPAAARKELNTILQHPVRSDESVANGRHKNEAQQLLYSLGSS